MREREEKTRLVDNTELEREKNENIRVCTTSKEINEPKMEKREWYFPIQLNYLST